MVIESYARSNINLIVKFYRRIKNKFFQQFERNPKLYHVLSIIFVAILFALFTSLVYINRAGSSHANNWPITWNISNSDNGVLYQFSEDVYKGQKLDWSFSPQVYVFPEIPISLVSYGFALGNIYAYFILVAAINNALLFLIILALIKSIYGKRSLKRSLGETWLASTPLALLPLIGTNTIFMYHLAPSYYYGSYLLMLSVPLILFMNNLYIRIIFGVFYVLTCAANPLLLVFSIPAISLTLIVMYLKSGLIKVIRLIMISSVLVFTTAIVRILFFDRLAGANASNYLSIELFAKRLDNIRIFHFYGLNGNYDKILENVSIIFFASCTVLVLYFARKFITATQIKQEKKYLSLLYLNLIPITSLLTMIITMSINHYYLWPVLIAPFVILLISVPRRITKNMLLISVLISFMILIPSSIQRVKRSSIYFNYRPPLTVCLDEKLPYNHEIGYATFSDGRKTALTSHRNIKLVQITNDARPGYWLTNKRYSTDFQGTFFIINSKGDESPIIVKEVIKKFGNPDLKFSCDNSIIIFSYSNKSSINRINKFYNESNLK